MTQMIRNINRRLMESSLTLPVLMLLLVALIGMAMARAFNMAQLWLPTEKDVLIHTTLIVLCGFIAFFVLPAIMMIMDGFNTAKNDDE